MRSAFTIACIAAVFYLAGFVMGADSPPRIPVSDLPANRELQNPFTFGDGSPVRTPADWERRRAELKRLFEDYEYGQLPAKPEKMVVERGEREIDESNEVASQNLSLKLSQGGKSFDIPVLLATPTKGKGKYPVIIQGAFRWPGQATPPPGERLKYYAARGYAVAEMDFQAIAPDNRERARSGGIYQLFGDDIDCGGLMAWAWGMHRFVDAIESLPEIDPTKVVVTGHSRYGKAALIAGAFDERIALTVPSHSGCAGCSPFRFIFGKSEQLHNIVGAFPYWFRPDFNQFVENVERLPIDQHELMALVAPRAMLLTEGTEDTWINPEGAQLTYLAAKQVYEFLGAGDRISIRYRPVGHIPSREDLLEFADHVFFEKPLSKEFGQLAYPQTSGAFTWDRPK
jgi:endo-1,4-beta-xylanase